MKATINPKELLNEIVKIKSLCAKSNSSPLSAILFDFKKDGTLQLTASSLDGEIISINIDFNGNGNHPLYFRNVNMKERFLLMPLRQD